MLTTNGHKINFIAEGDPTAPPIILIHGWTSFHGAWRHTIDALKSQYYCIAVDLLGFGHSDKPKDADYSIEAQAKRVLALADHLSIEKFTLMGHSMGGQIAMCIASMLAPQRVVKLIDVDGVVTGKLTRFVEGYVYPGVRMLYYLPFLVPIFRTMNEWPPIGRLNFSCWFKDMKQLPYKSWKTERFMAWQPGSHVPVYRAGQAIHALNLTSHLKDITASTLVIFGASDGTVPVADAHLAAQHIPNSELVLIEDCGHFPMYEKTEQFVSTVEAFLDS